MKCTRAFAADLLAVLRGESGDVEFLAHYPTCADCAAELRVWGELDGLLRAGAPVGGAHPEPEALLAYVDAPATLAASARDGIARHLAGCRSCSDEIGSLRRFDPARGVGAAPVAKPITVAARTAASPRPATRGRLARVLWHPGFAYALLALLLVPVVRDQIRKIAVPARVMDARQKERVAASPALAVARPAPETQPEAAAEPPAIAAPSQAVARGKAGPAAAPHEADEERQAQDGALPALADRMGGAATGAAPGSSTTGAVVVDLRVGAATVIPFALAEVGPLLRIASDGSDGPVEVRIRARAGARQLVQQRPRRANAIAVPIPPGWLAPGDYTITLSFPAAAAAADPGVAARRAAAPLTLGFSVGAATAAR
jgi:hypothetical protein